MPVLLIEGANTKPIFRITCEKLASYLPDVQQVVLPDTSHALCLEVRLGPLARRHSNS